MENAVDALKMMFAVFVFVVAISLTLASFTKAKETADTILSYTDKTNYYTWEESSDQSKGREVKKDVIIAGLFKMQKDTYITIVKSPTIKYIFTPYGRVTEVNGSRTTNIDLNAKENANYVINFINNQLGNSDIYYENIVDVTNKSSLGGEYEIAEDGTKLQITKGDNKVMVMYTKK